MMCTMITYVVSCWTFNGLFVVFISFSNRQWFVTGYFRCFATLSVHSTSPDQWSLGAHCLFEENQQEPQNRMPKKVCARLCGKRFQNSLPMVFAAFNAVLITARSARLTKTKYSIIQYTKRLWDSFHCITRIKAAYQKTLERRRGSFFNKKTLKVHPTCRLVHQHHRPINPQ